MSRLETYLRGKRNRGRKLLVPYVTAGIRADWLDLVRAVAESGADAIEVQIPFSDPAMDGPTVQAASLQALRRGITPASALEELSELQLEIPLAVMTYYNLVFRFGERSFVQALTDAHVSAVVLPDLPYEEAEDWRRFAREKIETVSLVAPNTPDSRLAMLCKKAEGFVYVVSTLGVTGEREQLAASAERLAKRVKAATDKPAIIGFGISSPAQAAEAVQVADGVIIASVLMRQVLEGASVSEVAAEVAKYRAAIDVRPK